MQIYSIIANLLAIISLHVDLPLASPHKLSGCVKIVSLALLWLEAILEGRADQLILAIKKSKAYGHQLSLFS